MNRMDPLTQGLLGAATAQLGFRQRIGGAGVTWLAAGAAMAADLDIFAGTVLGLLDIRAGSFTVMRYHRGISHSLFAAPIIALLIALPWWLVRRRASRPDGRDPPSLGLMFTCLCVAALSHPLLDWCTAYGTQLLAPISDRRFALSAIAIVDIIYMPILLLTVLTCCLVRRLRRNRARRATLIIGWTGFMLSVAYLAAGAVLNGRAVERTREFALSHAPPGAAAPNVRAYPYLGTIFLWRGTAQFDDRWLVARVRPLSDEGVTESRTVANVDNSLIRAARDLEHVRTYAWFADGQLRAEVGSSPRGRVVILHDMRYAAKPISTESLWPVHVTFDAMRDVVSVRRVRSGERSDNFGQFVQDVWREITTP